MAKGKRFRSRPINRAACSTTPRSPITQTRRDLEADISTHTTAIICAKSRLNELANIACLPPETLTEIFMDFAALEHVSHLCNVVPSASEPLSLDPEFLELCLATYRDETRRPSTLFPPSTSSVSGVSSRLTKHYPAAYKDFYGLPSNPPCVYKSGPAWRERTGPEAYRIVREARPVHNHPIAHDHQWRIIGTSIYELLDSQHIKWSSIDPVAFAEQGELQPFCPLLVWIGVYPESLCYGDAVVVAGAIKRILAQAGFPEIEVAFRESVVTRSVAITGPTQAGKLLPFSPLREPPAPVPDVLKPFTPALGLAIAPLKTPFLEGTGALYLRVGGTNSDKPERTVLLTAGHVARPLPLPGHPSERRRRPVEKIVALGDGAYGAAITNMLGAIGDLASSVEIWRDDIARLAILDAEGEDEETNDRRRELLGLVDSAKKKIAKIDKLHGDVTRFRTTPAQRTIGFVRYVDSERSAATPCEFASDWALIELYEEKIDWGAFEGNKIYIGGKLSPSDYRKLMFPRPEDQASYTYPRDGLLQARGVVPPEEIRSPRQVDAAGSPCLCVVKNGGKTGTTVGRANGLESFIRYGHGHGHGEENETSIAVGVLSLNAERGAFSGPGDSGSVVLERGGGVVGMVVGGGGGGVDGETDVTYLTPYWWLEEQIKKVFPECYMYDCRPVDASE